MTMSFHSFGAFGTASKKRLFIQDALNWAPKGFAAWLLERDQSPGMVNVRKNRECAHEVAARLIEEKRQELKDGTSQKDLLSLLSSSCVTFVKPPVRCNVHFFSRGKFCPTARMATERRRDCRPGSVSQYLPLFVQTVPAHP